jgi:hypothetical protein
MSMHVVVARLLGRCAALGIAAALAVGGLTGCAGTKTFHEVARAGDTVALAAGWKHGFSRDNITVTITPSTGPAIIYGPDHPAVRAVVNLYPDPVSSLMVSRQTDQDLTDGARTYAQTLSQFTGSGADWWQTTVFIDLPASLATGSASIRIANPEGESVRALLTIVEGTGTPAELASNPGGPLNPYQLASLERVPHNTINFAGDSVPYAIEVELTHAPDVDHGGVGRAGVINPRGEIKNLHWRGTGTSLRVILTPAGEPPLANLVDFKFFIAGGIGNLAIANVRAFDIDGNPVPGITASID